MKLGAVVGVTWTPIVSAVPHVDCKPDWPSSSEENISFNDHMRVQGASRKITSSLSEGCPVVEDDDVLPSHQIFVTHSQMKSWVKKVRFAVLILG
jgi:hypothetical protein